jgi:hypothetical protein
MSMSARHHQRVLDQAMRPTPPPSSSLRRSGGGEPSMPHIRGAQPNGCGGGGGGSGKECGSSLTMAESAARVSRIDRNKYHAASVGGRIGFVLSSTFVVIASTFRHVCQQRVCRIDRNKFYTASDGDGVHCHRCAFVRMLSAASLP